MKSLNRIKNIQVSVRLKVIGYIVMFSSWIIPAIIIDALSIRGNFCIIVMLIQMGVGGFLILLGGALKKRVDEDPYYTVPKNIFRVFRAWQYLLMLTAVFFIAGLLYNPSGERGWHKSVLLIAMCGTAIAAAVVGTVQHKKDKQNHESAGGGKIARANIPVAFSIRCAGCNKPLNPNDLRLFGSKKYCSSCYMRIQAEKQREDAEKKAKTIQANCSVCGREFPRSSLHIVNKEYMCDDCFQKEYSVDLQQL